MNEAQEYRLKCVDCDKNCGLFRSDASNNEICMNCFHNRGSHTSAVYLNNQIITYDRELVILNNTTGNNRQGRSNLVMDARVGELPSENRIRPRPPVPAASTGTTSRALFVANNSNNNYMNSNHVNQINSTTNNINGGAGVSGSGNIRNSNSNSSTTGSTRVNELIQDADLLAMRHEELQRAYPSLHGIGMQQTAAQRRAVSFEKVMIIPNHYSVIPNINSSLWHELMNSRRILLNESLHPNQCVHQQLVRMFPELQNKAYEFVSKIVRGLRASNFGSLNIPTLSEAIQACNSTRYRKCLYLRLLTAVVNREENINVTGAIDQVNLILPVIPESDTTNFNTTATITSSVLPSTMIEVSTIPESDTTNLNTTDTITSSVLPSTMMEVSTIPESDTTNLLHDIDEDAIWNAAFEALDNTDHISAVIDLTGEDPFNPDDFANLVYPGCRQLDCLPRNIDQANKVLPQMLRFVDDLNGENLLRRYNITLHSGNAEHDSVSVDVGGVTREQCTVAMEELIEFKICNRLMFEQTNQGILPNMDCIVQRQNQFWMNLGKLLLWMTINRTFPPVLHAIVRKYMLEIEISTEDGMGYSLIVDQALLATEDSQDFITPGPISNVLIEQCNLNPADLFRQDHIIDANQRLQRKKQVLVEELIVQSRRRSLDSLKNGFNNNNAITTSPHFNAISMFNYLQQNFGAIVNDVQDILGNLTMDTNRSSPTFIIFHNCIHNFMNTPVLLLKLMKFITASCTAVPPEPIKISFQNELGLPTASTCSCKLTLSIPRYEGMENPALHMFNDFEQAFANHRLITL